MCIAGYEVIAHAWRQETDASRCESHGPQLLTRKFVDSGLYADMEAETITVGLLFYSLLNSYRIVQNLIEKEII